MTYSTIKNSNDGFDGFHLKGLFQDSFDQAHTSIYDSEYAFYEKDIFSKIEKKFPTAKKNTTRIAINGNNDIVDDEVIYSIDNEHESILIAIKCYWKYNEFGIDEDDEETETEDISRLNARIICLTNFNDEVSRENFEKFFTKILSKDKKVKKEKRELNIICVSQMDGAYLKPVKTKKSEISIEDNYNDDFKEVSDHIVDQLNKQDNNGIVLLHSAPGCGKSFYMRYLTTVIKNKKLIYFPPDMTHRLADPEFMSLFFDHPNSVLFIEDAENALQKREGGSNQAVSNLLNNSDGLLADALRLQIVCTFNCPLSNVDPALLRPGRLIAEYKFDNLSKNKSSSLIKKIYSAESEHYLNYDGQPKSLAEIYNLHTKKYATEKNKQESIGFKRGY